MKKLSLLAIFLTVLVSCAEEVKKINAEQLVERQGISYEVNSNTPFTGSTVKYYKNGQVEERRNYKDGKMDGLYEMYYQNGQLMYMTNYLDGKKNGVSEEYLANGQLIEKQNYANGLIVETKKVVSAEEVINKEGILYEVNSTIPFNGVVIYTYENGKIQTRLNYKDGVHHGLFKSYWKNGQLAYRYNLKNGKMDGYQQTFTKDGNLAEIVLWKDDEVVEEQRTEYYQQFNDELRNP